MKTFNNMLNGCLLLITLGVYAACSNSRSDMHGKDYNQDSADTAMQPYRDNQYNNTTPDTAWKNDTAGQHLNPLDTVR
jgi:hypothetical protein